MGASSSWAAARLPWLLPQPCSGSWLHAAPRTWPAGGGQCRGPDENRFPPPLCSAVPRQQQLALEPMQLGFPQRSRGCCHHCQRLGQQAAALPRLPHLRICLGQQGQTIRPADLCPCGALGRQALVHLGHAPPLPVPVHASAQPPKNVPTATQLYKPLLSGEGDGCLCPLLG